LAVEPEAGRVAADCVAALDRQPLFRAMFDHAPMAQAIASADGTIERINPAFTSLLGYLPEDICGKSIMDITHPDDVPKSWSSARRVGLTLPRLSFQKRYRHKSGREVSALVTLSAIELDGCRTILGQIADLTAIKQAHSDAQRAHDRLQTALEGADAGTWEIDVATGHFECDDALRRKFGLPEHEATPSIDGWLASIHPEDRASVAAALRNAVMPGHGRFDHEFRVQCLDGAERWIRCVGRVNRDERGRATRAVGIAIEITRAKQAQLDRERIQSALRRTERRLAAIVANSRDAVIGTSPDLRVMTWNAAAEVVFGYTEAEAMGMSVIHLLAPERRHRIGERVATLRAGNTLPAIESECLRKNGERFDVEITMSPVPGDDGAPAWFSAIVRDVSQRKLAERRLRDSQGRLEEIARNVDQVFWTSDPAIGRILYVSPGYERVWGRSCASLYENPRSFVDGIHPEDRAAVSALLASHAAGDDFECEYRVVRPDGSTRRVWDKGYPVKDIYGKVTHYLGVAVDITDRCLVEQGQPGAR
jgi:PAS domain S-box-containing protein